MLKIKNKIPSALTIGGKIVERVLIKNEVVWEKVVEPVDVDYFYVENTYNGTNTISVKQTITGEPDSSTYAKTLQYSKDGLNWNTITLSETPSSIELNQNEKVYFRGNEGVFNYWKARGVQKAITTISANQTHTVGGNINTLLDYRDPYGLTLPQGAFNSIFENNTNLTSASDITFTPSVDGSLPPFCYLYLFKNCSNLTTIPTSIPATKQGQDACNGMFSYTAITTAPALPATILGNSCYYSMFEGCKYLVTPPELPATEMKINCYRSMFYGCTSLVNAPELPATTLAEGCYRGLFYKCSSLVNAPELPAMELAPTCYQSMFAYCSSLTSAPELPAMELATDCYRELFYKCSSLVNPPELPALILAEGCYRALFYDCSSLNNLTVYADDISATDCTTNWLYGVAEEGVLFNYGNATYTNNSPSGIPEGWVENNPNNPNYFYVENTYNGTNTISVKQTITGEPDSSLYSKTLQYSKDKETWTTITLSSTAYTIDLNQGEKVYFRNNEGVFNHWVVRGTEQVWTNIIGNKSHNIGGNINTLINYYTPNNLTLPQGVFYNVFRGNTNLVSAENLTLQPSLDGSLPVFAYLYLFRNCTSLINPPVLIAKTLSKSSYYTMFDGCTSLNNLTVYADDVSATNCTYNWLNNVASEGIFNNYGAATYTVDSPSGIPEGWVENNPNNPNYFYVENKYSGNNTVSIITTSESPNTTNYATSIQYSKDKTNWITLILNGTEHTISINEGEKVYFRNDSGYFNWCDSMIMRYVFTHFRCLFSFNVGGNLMSLIDYNNMGTASVSDGCFNNLFKSADTLVDASNLIIPNKTANSYCREMFENCTALTRGPQILPAMSLSESCYDSMYTNCKKLTSTPTLPATTLAPRCYYSMFAYCEKLTSSTLPATVLEEACYSCLFLYCSSLKSVTIYATTTATDAFNYWLDNVAPIGTLYNYGKLNLPSNSEHGVPTGWAIVNL